MLKKLLTFLILILTIFTNSWNFVFGEKININLKGGEIVFEIKDSRGDRVTILVNGGEEEEEEKQEESKNTEDEKEKENNDSKDEKKVEELDEKLEKELKSFFEELGIEKIEINRVGEKGVEINNVLTDWYSKKLEENYRKEWNNIAIRIVEYILYKNGYKDKNSLEYKKLKEILYSKIGVKLNKIKLGYEIKIKKQHPDDYNDKIKRYNDKVIKLTGKNTTYYSYESK